MKHEASIVHFYLKINYSLQHNIRKYFWSRSWIETKFSGFIFRDISNQFVQADFGKRKDTPNSKNIIVPPLDSSYFSAWGWTFIREWARVFTVYNNLSSSFVSSCVRCLAKYLYWSKYSMCFHQHWPRIPMSMPIRLPSLYRFGYITAFVHR